MVKPSKMAVLKREVISLGEDVSPKFYDSVRRIPLRDLINAIEDILEEHTQHTRGSQVHLTAKFVTLCNWLELPFGEALLKSIVADLDTRDGTYYIFHPNILKLLRDIELGYSKHIHESKPAVFQPDEQVTERSTIRPYAVLYSGNGGLMHVYTEDMGSQFTWEEAGQIVEKLSGKGVRHVLIVNILYEVSTVKNVVKFVGPR